MDKPKAKVAVNLRYHAHAFGSLDTLLAAHTKAYRDSVIVALNKDSASDLLYRATDWLWDNGYRDYYINFYDNTDHEAGLGVITIVVNNTDVALMLKLAMEAG